MKVRLLFVLSLLLVGWSNTTATYAQNTYEPPKLTDDKSWSLVLLPDPQTYVKFGRNQPIFELMTSWIAESIKPLNIGMVLCTGDLVEQNNLLNPKGHNGDQPSKAQWESIARGFGRLDGRVPYIAATGNHDFGYVSAETRHTFYDQYFPVDKNFRSQELLREVGVNAQGMPSLTNATYEVTSPHGQKILYLVLEFAPRSAILEWALKTINQDKYKDHFVILLTHTYLNAQSQHIEKEGYPMIDSNYGKAIYEKLVKPSKNIRMVFSGHIAKPNDVMGHIGYRTDVNAGGKKVHQMMFNSQALGGGWHGNGGDGWLRTLEFLPDGKTVKVKTFSPLFAISPATRHLAWRTEAHDQFDIILD